MCDRLLTRILAATLAAVLSLAFAMGTVGASIPTEEDLLLEELILSGISMHDLCLTEDGLAHKHDMQCAFCLPFSSPPASTATAAPIEALYFALFVLPEIQKAEAHRFDPTAPPRGPPAAPAPLA